jgi:hypothetical protein
MRVDDRLVGLSPGMAVTVEVETGSRRIIEHLFSPLMRHARRDERDVRRRSARPYEQTRTEAAKRLRNPYGTFLGSAWWLRCLSTLASELCDGRDDESKDSKSVACVFDVGLHGICRLLILERFGIPEHSSYLQLVQ